MVIFVIINHINKKKKKYFFNNLCEKISPGKEVKFLRNPKSKFNFPSLFFYCGGITLAVVLFVVGCGGGGIGFRSEADVVSIPTPDPYFCVAFDAPSSNVTYFTVSVKNSSTSASSLQIIQEGNLDPSGHNIIKVPKEFSSCVIDLYLDKSQRENAPPERSEYQSVVIFQ